MDDVVTAYQKLLEDGKPNEVYNVCSGQGQTCRELVTAMLGQAGIEAELKDAAPENRRGQIPVLVGDNAKLRGEVEWLPTRDVMSGVEQLISS